MTIARHKILHGNLDELVACYIATTRKSLRNTSVMELIEWSHNATLDESVCGTRPKGGNDEGSRHCDQGRTKL